MVLVNQEEPAYALFQLIPRDTPAESLENLKSRMVGLTRTRLITWQEFSSTIRSHVAATVLRNDYPEYRPEQKIMCLVRKKPGWPWGLTWNGGIAFTYRDYEQARNRYQSYMKQPSRYRPIGDRRRDPNNPADFLQLAGC